jgi:CRP-like cAMP-binding protein
MEYGKDHLFKETLRLLRLSPEQRSPRDILTLMEATSEVGFFKKMSREYLTDELHRECAKCITLKYFRAGAYIFNYGDDGDSFYIILRGQVAVLIPKSVLEAEKKTEERPAEQQVELPSSGSVVPVAALALPTGIAPEEINDDTEVFAKVKVLSDGASFGELALLTDQPRAASIQCLKESWIARLPREDFLRILKDYEEKKLAEMVRFLRSLTAFKSWTKYSLVKVTYFFEPRLYKLNQVVYRCNDPAEHAFIIKGGEFKFTYTIDDKPPANPKSMRRVVRRKQLQMYIKGASEIFGDDDIIEGRNRSLTCVCSSMVGEVIAIDKNDFLRRLQVPSTWEYLRERHKTEEVWKARRVKDLMLAEIFKAKKEESKREEVQRTYKAKEETGWETNRSYSKQSTARQAVVPLIQVRRSEAPGDHNSLFKTEVEDLSDRSISLHPTVQKPNTPVLSPKESPRHSDNQTPSFLPDINRSSRFSMRNSFKASTKAPPNFFVSPQEAVISRYKFRHLIAGRINEAMSHHERTMLSKLEKQKVKSRRSESMTVQLRSVLLMQDSV